MDSSHFFIGVIIALVAAAMIFIEKRPMSHVAMVVAFMLLSWGVYSFLINAAPPAAGVP